MVFLKKFAKKITNLKLIILKNFQNELKISELSSYSLETKLEKILKIEENENLKEEEAELLLIAQTKKLNDGFEALKKHEIFEQNQY